MLKVLLVHLVYQVPLAPLVRLASLVHQVQKANPEPLEFLAALVTKDLLDPQVVKVAQDLQVYLVHLAQLVPSVLLVKEEREVRSGHKVSKELLDQEESPVPQVPKARKEKLGNLDQREPRVIKVSLGCKDFQECRALEVTRV